MSRLAAVVAAGLCLTACGGGGPGDDDDDLPPWQRRLPAAADAVGERRGLVAARGIIHLHSPYSHDACDGEPRGETETGPIDEACLADLRAGLCDLRMDYAALTDHDGTMADEEFETLFSVRGDDELIRDGAGGILASRLACPDGHTVLVYVGGENDLMPVMLDRHPEGDVAARHDYYNANGADAAAAFRDHGGITWVPHTEGRDLAELRDLAPDGVEIYQLHANVDPDIRRDDLGLDPAGAVQAIAEFADTTEGGPEPDLAILGFLEPSDNAVGKWDALLGEGMRVSGSGGTDAHQNVFAIEMRDGERGDSYRRMMRWFSNVALVAEPDDHVAIEQAIATGRFFVAFEVFGTPQGVDVVARSGADTAELGAEVAAGDGYTLDVTVPEVYGLDASLPVPSIRARIVRADAGGVTEVAEGSGPVISAALDAPGAYRAEIMITPRHLGPYLGRLGPDLAEREHVWVYANPIYVR